MRSRSDRFAGVGNNVEAPAEPGRFACHGIGLDVALTEQARHDRPAGFGDHQVLFGRARARYANPEVEAALVDAILKLPAGLHVLEAPEGVSLKAGDLIVQINGAEALPHTFARARLSPGPDLLRVRRAEGDYQDVQLP